MKNEVSPQLCNSNSSVHSGFDIAYDISWAIFIKSVKLLAERSAALRTSCVYVLSDPMYIFKPRWPMILLCSRLDAFSNLCKETKPSDCSGADATSRGCVPPVTFFRYNRLDLFFLIGVSPVPVLPCGELTSCSYLCYLLRCDCQIRASLITNANHY